MSRHRNVRNLEKDWGEYDDGYDEADGDYWQEEAERRQDSDGTWYTKAEFMSEYSGTAEWDRAKRWQPPQQEPPPAQPPPTQQQQQQPQQQEQQQQEQQPPPQQQPPPPPPQQQLEVERRYDTDGVAYTKEEFMLEYGGTAEWERAQPIEQALQSMRVAGAPAPAPRAKPTATPKLAPAPVAPSGEGRRARAKAAKDAAREASGSGSAPTASSSSGAAPVAPSRAASEQLPALPPPPPSEQLNMVVIGHVDAGKSTLMGRLLLLAGEVDERTMQRYERESKQANKASFRFAWVLDQSEDERARGVTIDVGTAFFRTPAGARLVNVLDAPGHRDFVPSMIGGAAQADAALLVVNASQGEFEAGLSAQTKEHVLLARALGVTQLLVAVNQMDSAGWAHARFAQIAAAVEPLARACGFAPPRCVPVSALDGLNLRADCPPPDAALEWYAGRSLLDEIDCLAPTPREAVVGTRLCVHDTFQGSHLGPVAVSGTLQAGTLRAGQKLLLLPGCELLTAKALLSRGVPVGEATAGDHVEVGLAGCAADTSIAQGSVLCDPQRAAPLATRVEVQLRVFDVAVPLTKGQPFELYLHTASCSCVLRKVLAGLDRLGKPTAAKPRCLVSQSAALVVLELERPLCVQRHADCKPMGRLVLREAGKTLAMGIITAVHDLKADDAPSK